MDNNLVEPLNHSATERPCIAAGRQTDKQTKKAGRQAGRRECSASLQLRALLADGHAAAQCSRCAVPSRTTHLIHAWIGTSSVACASLVYSTRPRSHSMSTLLRPCIFMNRGCPSRQLARRLALVSPAYLTTHSHEHHHRGTPADWHALARVASRRRQCHRPPCPFHAFSLHPGTRTGAALQQSS